MTGGPSFLKGSPGPARITDVNPIQRAHEDPTRENPRWDRVVNSRVVDWMATKTIGKSLLRGSTRILTINVMNLLTITLLNCLHKMMNLLAINKMNLLTINEGISLGNSEMNLLAIQK